jgi:Helix-turn-helix domain
MRPCSLYATSPARPAALRLLGSLYGPHRVGVRLVMILLSARGQTAGATAEVLGCDASTVRGRIHRYHQHGIAGCVTSLGLAVTPGQPTAHPAHPAAGGRAKAWPIPRPYQRLGRPAMSLAAFRRRCARWPGGGGPGWTVGC